MITLHHRPIKYGPSYKMAKWEVIRDKPRDRVEWVVVFETEENSKSNRKAYTIDE